MFNGKFAAGMNMMKCPSHRRLASGLFVLVTAIIFSRHVFAGPKEDLILEELRKDTERRERAIEEIKEKWKPSAEELATIKHLQQQLSEEIIRMELFSHDDSRYEEITFEDPEAGSDSAPTPRPSFPVLKPTGLSLSLQSNELPFTQLAAAITNPVSPLLICFCACDTNQYFFGTNGFSFATYLWQSEHAAPRVAVHSITGTTIYVDCLPYADHIRKLMASSNRWNKTTIKANDKD